MEAGCVMATSRNSSAGPRPSSRVRVLSSGRRAGSRACRRTWRFVTTTSPISNNSSGPQPFSESPGGRDLESTLHELDVDELFVCGLATDYCVRATTLDGLRRGLAVRVIRDAIRGVDLKPGDSEIAIKEMRVNGAHFSESRGLGRFLRKG